jgi:hypothetical protein
MGGLLRRTQLTAVSLVVAVFLGAAILPGTTARSQDAPAAKKQAKAPKKAEAKPAAKPADKDSPEGGEPAADPAAGGAAEPPARSLPSADIWVLDFTYQKVAAYQPTEGIHRGEVYWYLLYRIENKTGQDREAYLSVTARSNKDKSYANVYLPDIEPLIERKVGKPLWGKVDEFQELKETKEKVEKGEAAAEKRLLNYTRFKAGEVRDCVAIFNKLDPGATSITITVEGLSNDFHLTEREGGGRQIQSRMYQLELERPGDEYAMNLDRFRLIRRGWTKKVTPLAVGKEG